MARHALPHVVEGTLVPLGLFYALLWLVGVWAALVGALAWSYTAILRRALLRRRIPGVLLLGALTLTVRTIIALATGSLFVYFLQPTLGTVALAGAFLASIPAGRPLAERLAADFVPFPPSMIAHPLARRLFLRITLLWAFVLLANAALTLWLLVSEPVTTFLFTKTISSLVVTGSGIGLSTLWFRRSMRRHGLLERSPVLVGAED
jgi:hypothetical protein